jgi:SAM-dependent methyltransferase
MLALYCAFAAAPLVRASEWRRRAASGRLPRRGRRARPLPRAAAASVPSAVADLPRSDKEIPAWAGGGPVSDFVNVLINSPLYGLMRIGARRVLISTAERKGVMWRDEVKALELAISGEERASMLAAITDVDLKYPDYYLQPFHAYEDGNMDWLPAFEARSATLSMGLRVWKEEQGLTPEAASERLRTSHFDAVRAAAPGDWAARDGFVAVDAGCSIGMSTVELARRLLPLRPAGSTVRIIGLDASPYFLAVAQRALAGEDERLRTGIEYVHALAEDCKMDAASVDWWSLQFVIHELPSEATRDVFAEAFRVLRPGGVLSLVDNDPASPVIRGLPPAIATLMKSTGKDCCRGGRPVC